MELNENEENELNKLVANLVGAINKTLSTSRNINIIIDKIKHRGYTVELALAAHMVMCKNKENKSFVRDTELSNSTTSSLRFEFNDEDVEFLKSLQISTGESENLEI